MFRAMEKSELMEANGGLDGFRKIPNYVHDKNGKLCYLGTVYIANTLYTQSIICIVDRCAVRVGSLYGGHIV